MSILPDDGDHKYDVMKDKRLDRIYDLETALARAVDFLQRRTAGQEANELAADIERLLG